MGTGNFLGPRSLSILEIPGSLVESIVWWLQNSKVWMNGIRIHNSSSYDSSIWSHRWCFIYRNYWIKLPWITTCHQPQWKIMKVVGWFPCLFGTGLYDCNLGKGLVNCDCGMVHKIYWTFDPGNVWGKTHANIAIARKFKVKVWLYTVYNTV